MVMKSVKRNQEMLNQWLFKDDEKFSKLGYFGIYPEDSVRLMMQGEAELYKELREQLLVQTAFVALDPKIGSILAMVGGRPYFFCIRDRTHKLTHNGLIRTVDGWKLWRSLRTCLVLYPTMPLPLKLGFQLLNGFLDSLRKVLRRLRMLTPFGQPKTDK